MNLSTKLKAVIFPACLLSLAAYSNPITNINLTSTKNIMADTTAVTALPAASAFERTIDGKQTHLFTMKNKKGNPF